MRDPPCCCCCPAAETDVRSKRGRRTTRSMTTGETLPRCDSTPTLPVAFRRAVTMMAAPLEWSVPPPPTGERRRRHHARRRRHQPCVPFLLLKGKKVTADSSLGDGRESAATLSLDEWWTSASVDDLRATRRAGRTCTAGAPYTQDAMEQRSDERKRDRKPESP